MSQEYKGDLVDQKQREAMPERAAVGLEDSETVTVCEEIPDTYRKTNVDNASSEKEGDRQRLLEPQPTKCVATEKNLALSPALDALVETASPKEVAKLKELPPREVQQQEPAMVLRLANPKRRRTIFLEELPPADVPFLEQSTPRKAAVFKKLLSKNAASLEEPFAVCHHERAVELSPRKSAVFRRQRARTASTSGNATSENVVPLEEPQPENSTTSGGPPPKPIGTLKKLASKVVSAVRKVVDHAQSGKSDGDKEVVDDVRVEPAIPEEKKSALAKVEVKQEEEEVKNRNNGDVQLASVAGGDSRPPSETSRGVNTCGIADVPEILKQFVVYAETARDSQSAAPNGRTTDERPCETDKKEEGKEEVDGKAEDTDSSSSLEDGEIRDDPSGVPSDRESYNSWPENYIYPATSRCRGYLIDPFLHYRAAARQSTYSNSRDSDTASLSSSSGTNTMMSAPASGSRGAPSEQFYADLVDRMMNLQLSSAARPDRRPHSMPPAGNSQIDDSGRYEYSSWVARKIPKRKSVKPSDIYFKRAPRRNYSDVSD